MVTAWTDPELAKGAGSAEHKIRAVLPEALLIEADRHPYRVPVLSGKFDQVRNHHLIIRKACEQNKVLRLHYADAEGHESERDIWPLGLIFWGERWTLTAWCEKRSDYRNFRLDRIIDSAPLDLHYPDHPERNLEHYLSTLIYDEPAVSQEEKQNS